MCDYSLQLVQTRDAKIGDELEVAEFPRTITRGLIEVGGDKDCAVCLKPGTELVIAVDRSAVWLLPTTGFEAVKFVQLDVPSYVHRDAFEYVDGKIEKIQDLRPGTRVRVLQMPAVKTKKRTIVISEA